MRYETPVYLAGCALYLPEGRQLAADAVRAGLYDEEDRLASEYVSAAVADGVWAPEMAVRAGADALSHSGLDPAQVGLLVHASINYQGHAFWDTSSFIQDQLDVRRAYSVNLNQMCNGGMAGVELAIAHVLSSPDRTAAMVTTADQFPAPGFDRWRSDYGIVYGDGATAAVVSTRRGFARILACNTITEPALEGMHRGADEFGVYDANRFLPIDIRRTKKAYLQARGRAHMDNLSATSVAWAVQSTLREASISREEVSLVVLPNLGKKLLQGLYYRVCGVGPEQTLFDFGSTVGHLGAGDIAAGVAHVRAHGLLGPGQKLLAVGAGGGYSWSAMALEIL